MSPRELEILGLAAKGLSVKEMARATSLSVHTVADHRKSLMAKLGASSIADAVSIGYRSGYLGGDAACADARQVGGGHYKGKAVQPWDYIVANGLGYLEGNVVKYISRYKEKNGLQDLEKARHYLDKLIEVERAKEVSHG